MRPDSQGQFPLRHALPVVTDPDQLAPPVFDDDIDPRSARIETVLDQFLDDTGRSLDHLTGGDLVNQQRRQLADRHGHILAHQVLADQPLLTLVCA